MLRPLLACVAVLASVALTASHTAATVVTATVRGADAVNVRRSPGPQAPAFAMLAKGAQVKVESVADGWAAVVLEHGERGYVNATFLEMPMAAVVTETAAPIASASPPPTDTPAEAAAAALTPRIEQKLAQVLERVAALESALASPSAGPDRTPERLSDTPVVRNADPLITPKEDSADLRDIGPSLALAGVGLVVGFFLGAAYGQRQERNRRQRVRF